MFVFASNEVSWSSRGVPLLMGCGRTMDPSCVFSCPNRSSRRCQVRPPMKRRAEAGWRSTQSALEYGALHRHGVINIFRVLIFTCAREVLCTHGPLPQRAHAAKVNGRTLLGGVHLPPGKGMTTATRPRPQKEVLRKRYSGKRLRHTHNCRYSGTPDYGH